MLATLLRRVVLLLVAVFVASSVAAPRALADGPLGLLLTVDATTLIPAADPALTDPSASDPSTDDPPHLSMGGPFKLFGASKKSLDPQNPFNQVVSFDTHDPNGVAGLFRKFGGHVKVRQLTNQVEVKYFYVGRTCGGGSTRVQLGIDTDGDGKFDHNAFGFLGDKPFGGACLMNQWVFEDMTNAQKKWDLSQFGFASNAFCGGNNMICSWNDMVTFLSTVFPNHQVLNYVLVDDSQSFFPADSGCAFFDVVSAGSRTLTSWRDVAGDGDQPNNC